MEPHTQGRKSRQVITPLTRHPGTTVILEPRYYGSIAWYATMAAYENAIVDYSARYDKRHKLTHRTTIADVNGPLDLTMPISLPADRGEGPLTWEWMLVSPHDEWWNIHRVTLESAYGRTPFFEFYIDRFLPALTAGCIDRFPTLLDINSYIDRQIRGILGIPVEPLPVEPPGEVVDLRRSEPAIDCYPTYYQVRADRLGFIGGLSILDLIFNLGPEAPLYLHHLLNSR